MTALRARLSDASWRAALWLDETDRRRTATHWWHHYGSRTIGTLIPAVAVLPFAAHPEHLLYALPAVILATLAIIAVAHITCRAHEIGLEDERHCPLCPNIGDDSDGPGWGWPDADPEPWDGPLDPFTADDMHMLEFQYRTEPVR